MIKSLMGQLLKSSPEKPFKLGTSRIQDMLDAILKGNKRDQVGKGRFRCYPTSASEARFPQKVPKVPK
jgi:hypothetical protein